MFKFLGFITFFCLSACSSSSTMDARMRELREQDNPARRSRSSSQIAPDPGYIPR